MKWNVIRVMMGLFVAVLVGMAGCGGGSSNNAPNNKTTVANAGPAQNVVAGILVTLNGSQSTGADGSLITYQWSMTTKPAGSTATIINPTTVNPTFTPDLSGQYSLKLVITDTKSVTSESTVIITASVVNAAPVANAGAAQSVVTGAVVTLDGSASSDANGDLLTYSWSFTSKPAGSSAALSNATDAKPTFTVDVAGAYVLNLVVNDGKVNSAAVTVTITASVANAAPVANAGAAQSVVTGAVVTLDGSASSDANGDLLTYSWAFTSKPAESSAALSSASIAKPTFTADVAGVYVLNLVVNDGKVNSSVVTATITASVGNAAPVSNAGTAQIVVTNTAVTLDGSGSSDANGDPLTYNWTFTSKPIGSSATLSNTIIAKPIFTPDVAGAYVISLVVNDGKVNSAPATVTMTSTWAALYSIIDIGTLGGTSIYPEDINNAGQVVGFGSLAGNTPVNHAFLYSDGKMTDLGTLGGTHSYAKSINDVGHVVGSRSLPDNDYNTKAFLYSNGSMSDINYQSQNQTTLTLSGAIAINNSDQIVGSIDEPVIWSNGTVIYLGNIPGGEYLPIPSSINNSGQVVGIGYVVISNKLYNHAFLYNDSTMTDLFSSYNPESSNASSINDSGQVVGVTYSYSGTASAYLYSQGQKTNLGTLGGIGSTAYGINNVGQIVGDSSTAAQDGNTAFLYSNGSMINLINLIPTGTGWTKLITAKAINDNGQIVGYGTNNGQTRAFLMTPNP